MSQRVYRYLLYPLLAKMDPEAVHHSALSGLEKMGCSARALAAVRRWYGVRSPFLERTVFGVHFANPLGLAAGFDKNGRAVAALAALGFGHIEVGTVTPKPQDGNPKPRLFRLQREGALINRLGFPNDGMERVAARLSRKQSRDYVLGVNIGPNKASIATGQVIPDYLACLDCFAPVADYVTINISSPNTPGLRELQGGASLDALLAAIFRHVANWRLAVPVLVKIAPDLATREIEEAVGILLSYPVAGIVATNTTVSRPLDWRDRYRQEQGGLSGRPLREHSTGVIRRLAVLTEGRLPIIGVGGIFAAEDAEEKLRAGASLLQLYTGFVYQGPATPREILRGLMLRTGWKVEG
ncbi:MAG: quinone-dependent dihydroorotate dehydrogenase [Chloroflexi bacterium]|nr:quinone-dependent dihydroorotate dehydrogenase [Chloroflexota bacterium]